MGKLLKNIVAKVPGVRLAKQKASQNISLYFKGAKFVSKQREKMIVYDASKKVTGNNNELMKGCLDQINEDNEDVLTFYSSDSDDENDNQQFCFSMLCTDDDYDCDDEAVNLSDEENEKPNQRPTPPEWSLTINRKSNVINQTAIDHRVIDKFFGCEYESVDMLEIFPKINPKRAKRRKSSMKWDTPLRHSVLPKY